MPSLARSVTSTLSPARRSQHIAARPFNFAGNNSPSSTYNERKRNHSSRSLDARDRSHEIDDALYIVLVEQRIPLVVDGVNTVFLHQRLLHLLHPLARLLEEFLRLDLVPPAPQKNRHLLALVKRLQLHDALEHFTNDGWTSCGIGRRGGVASVGEGHRRVSKVLGGLVECSIGLLDAEVHIGIQAFQGAVMDEESLVDFVSRLSGQSSIEAREINLIGRRKLVVWYDGDGFDFTR